MTALEEALDYAEERNWDLIEVNPNDVTADARTMLRVNAGGREEVLVEVGWGAAGLYVDVRFFVEDEPIDVTFWEMGRTVTIYGETSEITPPQLPPGS